MTEDLNGLDARISTRGYFERILVERERATELAEAEREKAAEQVRRALEENMRAGDARLQDHITHQVEQVQQGLAALTALLAERDGRMDDRFEALREATTVARAESKEALLAHNGLIRKMETQSETFPTRKEIEEGVNRRITSLEKFQYRILGALGVAMIFVPIVVSVAVYLLTRTAIPVEPQPRTGGSP